MAYKQIKGSLPKLFGEGARALTRHAARQIAGDAGGAMVDLVRANTPRRTGRTADSWGQIETFEESPGVFVSGAESSYFVARLLETGVAPHDLRSRRERTADDEPVRHPGFAGTFPLARAAAEVDETIDEIAAPSLVAWALGIERLGS